MNQRPLLESMLLDIAEFVSASTGPSFAEDLVSHAARTLGMEHVQIGRLDASGAGIRILAGWQPNPQTSSKHDALSGSAAGAVLERGSLGIAAGACAAYPADPDLKQVGAESYVGAVIPDADGKAAGLIAACSHQPLDKTEPRLAALRILAAHAANVFGLWDSQARLSQALEQFQDALDQAERRQNEREAWFHTLLDWTYDWEYWVQDDGSFSYMTPSVERFTGYPNASFEQNPSLIDSIVHPDDREKWREHLEHSLHDPQTHDFCELELRIQHRDGHLLWVEHRCRPVIDDAGVYHGRRVSVIDITARKEAEEQIRNLAYFDPLTGLPNRRLLLDRLGHALVASRRSRQYGALLMIDLDHFKSLNDTQGHDVGDRLLVEVARRMSGSLRAEDTVARLGGDEYVVMLETLGQDEQTAANEAELIAEKIRLTLNAPYPILYNGQTHYCSSSIGMTLFQGDSQSVESLLKQADVALYQSKDAGRDTIRFFNPEMQKAIESRLATEAALRQALLQGELELYYQPQIDQHGRRIGAEALLRWKRPDLGLVPPMDFIPLAEETGLIVPIGHWVVDTACAQLKQWESCPTTSSLQLAINVSARQFHQPDFVNQVRNSLDRSGADPSRLKLELTESVVLEHAEVVIERMHQLRMLGVSFSMDDFGTGYSSLSYLKRLPLDQLKIDKSFVRDLTTDPNDAAIVRAILAMSHSLGIQVIAEGVETEEQKFFLRDNGCFAFQGYLFGKPSPIADWHSQPIQAA